MKKVLGTLGLFVSFFFHSNAQNYPGIGGLIPDGGSQFFPAQVSGLVPGAIDTVFGLESVTINISHPLDFDLNMALISPGGIYFELNGFNGFGSNYTNTVFKYNVAPSIVSQNPPFTGTFRPTGLMHLVNNFQNGNGTWALVVSDWQANGLSGSVVSWSLTFGNNPAKATSISSSNLPIVVLDTYGFPVGDEPKQNAKMGIIDNGVGQRNYINNPYNAYNNKIGIELRGNSSQFIFPQKPYGIETRNNIDSILDTTLLGMPAEHDWILYPPYNDRSFFRNDLTYKLSNELGNYASRTRFCEVVLNKQYIGLYILLEKIKRDDKRVKVKKLDYDDNAGDSLTGGYVYKVDWNAGAASGGWNSQYDGIQYKFHYPKIPTVQQAKYLQAYVDSFENALYGPNFTNVNTGYAKFIEVGTFIDYMLITEITKNLDGYRASLYLHKENIKDAGGKIKAGPMWDYNFAYGDNTSCGGTDTTGWEYQEYACDPKVRWFNRLVLDTNYTNKLKCRWIWLRTKTLKTSYINNYLDSVAAILNEAQQRHYQQWPILGISIFGSPLPAPLTYLGEVDYLKKWTTSRMNWLDANLPGTCYELGIKNKEPFDAHITIYPNPFSNEVSVNYFLNETTKVEIEFVNQLGQTVQFIDCGEKPAGDYTQKLDGFNTLPNGLYLIKVKTKNTVYCNKIIKQ